MPKKYSTPGAAAAARWRAAHPEKNKAVNKASADKHREKRRAHSRAYGKTHRKELREKDTQRRAKKGPEFRERKAALARAWSAANKERKAATDAAYRKSHPDEVHARRQKRRARIKRSPVNDFTAAQWQQVKQTFKHCCSYCGKKTRPLTMDHITPLSHGGAHTLSNIVPACVHCNSVKRSGPPLKPVQPLLL